MRESKNLEIGAFENEAYEGEYNCNYPASIDSGKESIEENVEEATAKPRTSGWSNDIEFLMSCIAMSVGFGNIWRFPFTAYENGGGAFLIPYIILLILVGKPFYYLEMIVGQFSGRMSIKVWSASPGFKGLWMSLKKIHRTIENANPLDENDGLE